VLRTALFRLLTLSAFAFACQAVTARSADSWTSVRSKNFSIVGNASAAQLQSAAVRLEQFRWAFSHLYPQLKLNNDTRTRFIIFKDAASYFEFLPKRPDGSTDIGVAGYFQPAEDVNYITLAASDGQSDPYSTAVHEYFHSIAESNFERSQLPPWANEGLAEYFETVRVENGRNIIVGDQQTEHLRLLRRSALIPLAEFFAITTADLKLMTAERRRLYYAEAWAVVHALIQNESFSLDKLSDGVATWTSGDGRTALYSKLEQEVVHDIRGVFPQSLPTVATENIPIFDTPTAQVVPAEKVSAMLGDLLLHTGEMARSETFLREALLAQKDDPDANGSLGSLLVREDKPVAAMPYLQKAVTAGNANPVVLFNFAYATLHDHMDGNAIAELPDDATQVVRSNLRRAIAAAPTFAESYRLLALVDFVRDEELDDAVALLQKGLAVKRDDPEMQLLLARILLRREDVGRAKQIAEQIASTTSDTKQKAEADEIVKAVYDYTQAKAAAMPVRLNITVGERMGLVVLKRSWLTDDDVAAIERERDNNNYNRIIIRAISGEQQLVGHIESITCSGSSIAYRVRTADGVVISFNSPDFNGVKMTVAREGDNTFQIGCGANLAKQLAVINYRPATAVSAAKTLGQLTAISFVGDDFRLKTIDEMFAARLVAIDDDTLRRSGPRPVITAESIRRSIEQNLRRPEKNEERVTGTIEKIECSSTEVDFKVLSGGKSYKFARGVPGRVDMGWFTVASSQLPVTCGSGPLASNAILTFSRTSNFAGVDGELKSIEFVPDGFRP
jgi:Tfp pilus assembly protein PilF